MRSKIVGLCAVTSLAFTGLARAATLYATSNGDALVRVDTVTGLATTVGPTGTIATYSSAFSPNGRLYGIANYAQSDDRFGSFNLATGAFTFIGSPFGGVTEMLALEVAADGTVYGGSRDGPATFWTINPATGVPTAVGNHGILDIGDFSFSPNGTLWAVNNQNRLYTIDVSTGASTLVSTISGLTGTVGSISFDESGTLFAANYTNPSSLYAVNPLTGAATAVNGTSTGVSMIWGGDITVPEPASLASLAAAATALARRRRQRSDA